MKYAWTKSEDSYPRPVCGWYDLQNFDHASLPPDEELTEVDELVWESRLEDPSGFVLTKRGKVVPK